MSPRRVLGTFLVALALTLLSSAVESTRLEVQDWDCPPAPASCARPVVVVGWPVSYISDFHGLSVVGSADLMGALMGEDVFRWPGFLADVAFYLALLTALGWARRTVRRRAER